MPRDLPMLCCGMPFAAVTVFFNAEIAYIFIVFVVLRVVVFTFVVVMMVVMFSVAVCMSGVLMYT